MNRRTRLRRTGILCLHFMRNVAFYRAWTALSAARRKEQFWRTANGNFIDMAVLDWCKLFGDKNAKHHWSKSVTDHTAFLHGLHTRILVNAVAFEEYRLQVRTYRDKFVAHLDELHTMDIPNLQPALESVRFLYQFLRDSEDDVDALIDAPDNGVTYYREHLLLGRRTQESV